MKITKAPTYLDSSSLLTEKQLRKVNSIIKSQINRFTSKAHQYQKTSKIESPITARSSALDSIICYEADGYIDIRLYCSLSNTNDLELFEIDGDISYFSYDGYFDSKLEDSLKDYGNITFEDGTFVLHLYDILTGAVYINIRARR